MSRSTVFLLLAILSAFSWMALVGVVRAEFLRARNFEFVRAARALGVSNLTIIRRHVLPNAGHNTHFEHPTQFLSLIQSHLTNKPL